MKILVISNYRETVSVRPEAELFIGLKQAGLDVTIMTYGDAAYVEKFKMAGIKTIDFHPEKKLNKKEIKTIREELIRGKYDILHLFNSKAIINGIQAAKSLPVKVVLYRGYTGNINWYDPTAYFKYLHPRVDKIWCIAKSIEEHIKRQSFFNKNKPVTIHKGHDLNWYKNIEAIDRKELNEIHADAFWVVNVANNRRMKGTAYLLNAMSHLPPGMPIHLLLVGKNLDHQKNLAIANNSPNKNNIHFLGYRTDVLKIVKASDLFVLPSLFGEATTKSVIEAMALGTTPVITDISGNKGLVLNEKCGLVIPSKNEKAIAKSILTLFNDQTLNKEYGRQAQAHIAQYFNINKTILEIKNMYETLLHPDKKIQP